MASEELEINMVDLNISVYICSKKKRFFLMVRSKVGKLLFMKVAQLMCGLDRTKKLKNMKFI